VAKMTVDQLVERLSPHLHKRIREAIAEQKKQADEAEAKAARERREREAQEAENARFRERATDFGKLLSRLQTPESDAPGVKEGEGRRWGRFLSFLAAGQGDRSKALRLAQAARDEWSIKALEASDDSSGGAFIPAEAVGDVIPRLVAESVVSGFNPIRVRLEGNTLRFPRIDGGATAQWIGEGEQAPASQPTTDSVTLTPKKLAVVVPISNDLIRRAPQNVETQIRDDTVGSIDAAVDLAWIRGPGTGGQPAGFRNHPGILTRASGGTSAANIQDDLGRAIQSLMDANVPMTRPGFLLSPRTWRALFTLLDANSNPIFRDEMATNGTLFGVPFARTSQIPVNLGGGGNESEVYLVDFAQVIVGEQVPVAVDVFDQGSYTQGGNTISLIQTDQIAMRFIVETDLAMRHGQAVHVTTGVTWGA